MLLVTKIFDDLAVERVRELMQSAIDAEPKRQAYKKTLWLADLRTGHWLGSSFSSQFSEFAERNHRVRWALAAANLKLGRVESAVEWLHPAALTRRVPLALPVQ